MNSLAFKFGEKLWQMALETAVVAAAGIAGARLIENFFGGSGEGESFSIDMGPQASAQGPPAVHVVVNVNSNNGNAASEPPTVSVNPEISINLEGMDEEEDEYYDDEEE